MSCTLHVRASNTKFKSDQTMECVYVCVPVVVGMCCEWMVQNAQIQMEKFLKSIHKINTYHTWHAYVLSLLLFAIRDVIFIESVHPFL